MTLVLIAITLIALAVLAAFSLYGFQLSIKNCRRLNGSVSWKRIKKETRHLGAYLLLLNANVFFVMALLNGTVFMVHTYVIPLDIVEQVFGQFELSSGAWEKSVKEGRLGNLDQDFEDWSAQQGYSPNTPEVMADLLFRNWSLILLLIVLFLGAVFFFEIRWLKSLTQRHENRAIARQYAYQRRDLVRNAMVKEPTVSKQPIAVRKS